MCVHSLVEKYHLIAQLTNETSQARSTGRVVSQNKTRPGIPSLRVGLYVAQMASDACSVDIEDFRKFDLS